MVEWTRTEVTISAARFTVPLSLCVRSEKSGAVAANERSCEGLSLSLSLSLSFFQSEIGRVMVEEVS